MALLLFLHHRGNARAAVHRPEQVHLNQFQQFLATLQQSDRNLSGVCIVFRSKSLMEQYESVLKNFNFPIKRIQRDRPDNPLDARIRIGTMHRVKGLQFDYILIPGLNSDILPLQGLLNNCPDPASQERFITGERCLLHVAATRAKKQAIVSYYGKPSPFLPGVADL